MNQKIKLTIKVKKLKNLHKLDPATLIKRNLLVNFKGKVDIKFISKFMNFLQKEFPEMLPKKHDKKR
jgi:hypothetical protein